MVRNALFLLASLQIAHIGLAAAKKPQCNKVGWDAGHESFASADVGGYAACSKVCSEHKKCKSFAYSSTDCQLYNKVVKGNYIHDKNSPYTFNDAACGASASTTTAGSISDSASTSTIDSSSPTTSQSDNAASTTVSDSVSTTTSESASATSSASGLICDVIGLWVGDSKYQIDIISVWGGPANTRTKLACYNYCKNYGGCVAYAYNIGACSLFGAPLAGNFQPDPDTRADYYDMACGVPPATADDITTTSTDESSAATTDSYDSAATDSAAASTMADFEASTTDAPAAVSTNSSAATFTDTGAAATTDAADSAATSGATDAAASSSPTSTGSAAASTDSVIYTGRPSTDTGAAASSMAGNDSAAATSSASAAATDAAATTASSSDAAATTVSAQKFRRYHPRRKSF